MSQKPEVDAEKLDITDELIAERRQTSYDDLPDDMPSWMQFIIRNVDRLSHATGKIFCLLLIPMMYVMIHEVVGRKLFISPTDWAYDISRMSSGAMFMLGAAYGLSKGIHIRADFLYRNFSVRTQGIVDAVLYLFLFFPSMILFFEVSAGFAYEAWARGETSMDTSWMPPVGPIRTAMPIGIFLLMLQGTSELLKSIYAAQHSRWP